MRGLTALTRRGFGQGLGAALSLAGLAGRGGAHDGPHELAVGIRHFAFDPARIEILVGDSITWTNGDLVSHSATAEDEAWDTGPIKQGGQARITFATPGAFPYVCAFHPHMTGTVVVRSRAG